LTYPVVSKACQHWDHSNCGKYNVDESANYKPVNEQGEIVYGGNFCICYCHYDEFESKFNWRWYEDVLKRDIRVDDSPVAAIQHLREQNAVSE